MNDSDLFNFSFKYNKVLPEEIIEWYMEDGDWELLDQYYNDIIEGRKSKEEVYEL